MSEVMEERIAVVAEGGTLGVTLNLGDVQVSVRALAPLGSAGMSVDALRAAAIRTARRALQVALEDLASEAG